MRKEILLQNHLKDTFLFMHKKRQSVLFGAVDALMEGASLTLSSLGRNFKGNAKERHQIRKMDRLLGNKHLHQVASRKPIFVQFQGHSFLCLRVSKFDFQFYKWKQHPQPQHLYH